MRRSHPMQEKGIHQAQAAMLDRTSFEYSGRLLKGLTAMRMSLTYVCRGEGGWSVCQFTVRWIQGDGVWNDGRFFAFSALPLSQSTFCNLPRSRPYALCHPFSQVAFAPGPIHSGWLVSHCGWGARPGHATRGSSKEEARRMG